MIQADILSNRCHSETVHMEKHKFDIQGTAGGVFAGISKKLGEMKSGAKKKLTVVALEYPTNPDRKDCDLVALEPVLRAYQAATGTQVSYLPFHLACEM